MTESLRANDKVFIEFLLKNNEEGKDVIDDVIPDEIVAVKKTPAISAGKTVTAAVLTITYIINLTV